ncbi:hypothetical protein Naga_100040g38 [Nannochloropsis gaditana]|uniref:Uncharacterized protein n=1 Tax=Nannochloropsis gaditana TaxID=72520 RepID=W7TKL7_9STRA|nr:hypothetical protein Naga_100040g38 [Nannochloropsis gaditana]
MVNPVRDGGEASCAGARMRSGSKTSVYVGLAGVEKVLEEQRNLRYVSSPWRRTGRDCRRVHPEATRLFKKKVQPEVNKHVST